MTRALAHGRAAFNNAAMIGALAGKRVALVHHWLLSMRGGERVLETIAEQVPDAPIYTLFARPAELSEPLRRRDIRVSSLDRIPGARNHHRNFLPLYPRAVRGLDCREYEVVIVSDAAVVKGVTTDRDATVLCYCHSPMRSVWELTETYASQLGPVRATALRHVSRRVRGWDRRAAARVSHFAANSRFVQERIRRYYGRESEVIFPPVRVPDSCPARQPEDWYLMVGELSEYKRADLGVAACVRLGRRLKVIGDGPQMPRLRRTADANVELLGRRTDAEIRDHLAQCRALLFCAEEDFGIVPVEAMAAGCPVIAFGRGGATETVIDGQTGLFFEAQTPESVVHAIQHFETMADAFNPARLHVRASEFSGEVFTSRISAWIERCVSA